MLEVATLTLQLIAQGGAAAVIVILGLVIVALVWDRIKTSKALTDTIQKVYDAKDRETDSIKEIVDQYHKGNIDLVHALNEIKIVLVAIQNNHKH